MPSLAEPMTISQKYDHLLNVISSERFLKMQGIGNEVPFFICDFLPEEAVQMEDIKNKLINRLGLKGITVLDVNLYDISIELLQKRNIFDRVLQNESSYSKEELKELFQSVLDSENHLIPAIVEKMAGAEFDLMFLSGVGEVFPYIRSHNILNNLQSKAKDKPTVMFFPGKYSHSQELGFSLDLFGRLHDDRYYRAFNIFHCEP